jgi:SpoVK/Ycf46/Vps4 family AAA+-type ATPase
MGSAYIRETIPFHTPSVLLYGPPGCGKTMLVRAIATHLNAMIIDLSPFTIQDIYVGERNGHQRLLYSAFKIAREFQPAIIYIDECEKIFAGAKKGKGKKKKGGKKGDPSAPSRIKKDLITFKKLLKPKDRVIIIGCTSQVWDASQADLRTFFKKKIYIPHPNYATRKELWEHYIAKEGVEVNPNKFHFSVLA